MPSGRRVFKGVVTGMAFSAVAFVVADVLRPLPGPAQLLDWDEIRDRAKDRLPGDLLNPRTRRRLEDHYASLAAEVEGPFVVFIIGFRVNQFFAFRKWWPVAAAMPRMLKVLSQPDVTAQMAAQGSDVVRTTPQEFGRFVQTELKKYGEIVKSSGLKLE